MNARILDGTALAKRLRQGVAEEVAEFKKTFGRLPGLAVVLVGEDPASTVYVGNKEKAAREVGMESQVVRLPAEVSRERLLGEIHRLGKNPAVDGLLVQLPLPRHLSSEEIQRAVPFVKDVDGLHPENAGRLFSGSADALVPCTPRGVMALIDETGMDLKGREVVVVGRSAIVGKPVSMLLLARHATVTMCHSRTRDLAEVCRRADVLVAAVGIPGLIRGGHVREGAVVIDVGMNKITDPEQARDLLAGQPERLARFEKVGHTLVGDVHFGQAAALASWITPVPGGVGPLTVAMLLDNTLRAARRQVQSAR